MTPIATAVSAILAKPAPVIVIDTCSLLDLFRRELPQKQPKAPATEIQAAIELLDFAANSPGTLHLIVPELVPGEYSDHANRIVGGLASWINFHDENQQWITEIAQLIGLALPPAPPIEPYDIHEKCRSLADGLLTNATVLARDPACVDRALARLIAKRRPSQNKEIKDSMNLEQILELCRLLANADFTPARVFVSSNTKDFAADSRTVVHPEIAADFMAVGLIYHTSLGAALGRLRAQGELP